MGEDDGGGKASIISRIRDLIRHCLRSPRQCSHCVHSIVRDCANNKALTFDNTREEESGLRAKSNQRSPRKCMSPRK